jgi:enamine deaminase RidA (YjgF/YER057c/UK114 family)
MKVQRYFTGSTWEPKVGYCRALRVGEHVFVSGTAPVADGGGVHAPGDAYSQARRCFTIVEKALKELGAGCEHVVRTRMYVTDASRWEEFGRAHAEFFGSSPPATALIEVKALIDPQMLVEVEVDALVPPPETPAHAERRSVIRTAARKMKRRAKKGRR